MMLKRLIATAALVLPLSMALYAVAEQKCASGAAPDTVKTTVINSKGKTLGNVTLTEADNHGVLVTAELKGLTEGWHAFHIHEKGVCTAPDFKSAGGHFNPEKKAHGFESDHGAHAGDLPNAHVGKDGKLVLQYLAPGVTLKDGPNSLLDADGSAIVLHEKADDYKSDPAGDAGGRVACGAFTK